MNWTAVFFLLTRYVTAPPFSPQQIVGFTKGQTNHLHISRGNKVMYNKNITSVGAYYDIRTGDFICEVPGLYVFSIFSLTMINEKASLELMKNDQHVLSLSAFTHGDYDDAGNTAVISLQKGDRVYLKAHNHDDNALFGLTDEIYCTLTGELIFPDYAGAGAVGFTVALSSRTSLLSGEIVKYDHVVTNVFNESDVYDVRSGKFIVPIGGYYVFHYHAVSRSRMGFWLDLYHNTNYVNSVYGQPSGSVAAAGNSVVLHLQRGDRIYVKVRHGQPSKLFGSRKEVFTTFSGVLLIPDASLIGKEPSILLPDAAFSVGLTHDFSSANGHIITFDQVFSNLGLMYEVKTGIFTAPAAGLYAFHFHVLTQQGEKVRTDLKHNQNYIDTAYGHTQGIHDYGGNAAVLELKAGDKVYLDISRESSYLYGRTHEVYCTFSGYLLAPFPDIHFNLVG